MGGKQSKHRAHYNRNTYSYTAPTPAVARSVPSASPYSVHSSTYGDHSSRYTDHSYRYTADYDGRSKVQSMYSHIGDNYDTLEQVIQALSQAGLESSNLILGIDFTKSNEWTGSRSFKRKCLHHLGDNQNPYEQAISIIGRTLSDFDEDNLIPCYGFGDASTHDQEVFSFHPEDRPCNGFEEVLSCYRNIVPNVNLAGPTSFAPIIETAIGIVDNSGGQYHVLVIIADGQVTRSVDTGNGQLSPQEQSTINAIVKASKYPLSIVLVGVGDGPWDMMHKFDDNIPTRSFDNFQFVNFTQIISKNIPMLKKETEFSVSALMEIPSQYKATIGLQLLGNRKGTPKRYPLPPPTRNRSVTSQQNFFRPHSSPLRVEYHNHPSAPSTHQSSQSRECPICLWSKKDLAFGCGHQTCYDCGRDLNLCTICQTQIITRIRLYE